MAYVSAPWTAVASHWSLEAAGNSADRASSSTRRQVGLFLFSCSRRRRKELNSDQERNKARLMWLCGAGLWLRRVGRPSSALPR